MTWRYQTLKLPMNAWRFNIEKFNNLLEKQEINGWEYVSSFPVTLLGTSGVLIATFRQPIKGKEL